MKFRFEVLLCACLCIKLTCYVCLWILWTFFSDLCVNEFSDTMLSYTSPYFTHLQPTHFFFIQRTLPTWDLSVACVAMKRWCGVGGDWVFSIYQTFYVSESSAEFNSQFVCSVTGLFVLYAHTVLSHGYDIFVLSYCSFPYSNAGVSICSACTTGGTQALCSIYPLRFTTAFYMNQYILETVSLK